MPAIAPPVSDERSALREYLAYHQSSYFAVSYGLTDEQARSAPTASALSIGGLIKHATGMQQSWMARVAAAPEPTPRDGRMLEEIATARVNEHVLLPEETLDGVLRAFADHNAEALRLVETVDLDAPVPVPHHIPWFPKDLDAWSVRWVILHVINELARHAGHADIIRETIDGATLYELIAGSENWEPTPWLTPWQPG